ncbi:hypothetical protein [Deinococcus cellulosilyticus]|uniref:Uncharacterized protein n=1 Tax=Deinococcus cellulosilyticus (strain DSM 18568 / NBRC 106333 / KACC 11606 / 5516J-15) TaxID=1223518 RepID=A0A511NBC6_DEIC1|nr:hypothetical protein [Deinococcus cellulosilyticus]GEM50125.1 hypothetical protein DC3_57600 [Deinococcus cellulosilyticus NBRC 106333 = KACC 11606]
MPYQTLQSRVVRLEREEPPPPGTLFFEREHLFLVCPYCGFTGYLPGDTWSLTGPDDHPTLTPDVQCLPSCGARFSVQGGQIHPC